MTQPPFGAKTFALLLRSPHTVASHLVWKLWRDECPQRAGSLAYSTLLSLVPVMAVAFAVLKGFGGLKPIQQQLEQAINTHLVTTSSWQAMDYLEQFAERAHAGAIGALGFLAFVLTAVSLLNTVAGAFNRVWGVSERRRVKDRFVIFFTLIILGPVLFGASISITASLSQATLWSWLPVRGMGTALRLAIPFLLTWAGFLLLYAVVPSVPMRLGPAVLGSLAAAGMWELLKLGFETYVTSIASYGKLYASLGVLPVFLVWIYVSWLTALLGFELAFFLQHPDTLRGPAAAAWASRGVPTHEALRAFVTVAEAFVRGSGPVRAARLAERLRLPEGTIFAALAELERQGFLARVEGPSEAYLPRRAPATIRVADLWQALGGRTGAAEGDALARLLAGAAEASARAMGSTTVQDLIDAGASPAAAAAGSMAPPPADLTDPA